MYALGNLGEVEVEEATDYAGLRKAEEFLREGLTWFENSRVVLIIFQ